MGFGCSIRVHKDITKGEIIALCKDLSVQFGRDCLFSPLKRVEGGIEWVEWKGKRIDQYKNVRFIVNGKNKQMWPNVDDDCFASWLANDDVVIQCDQWHNMRVSHVHICTYDHNTSWTMKEWKMFKRCLTKYLG